MTIDSATVAAFVDGELDDLTARRIEKEAQANGALAAEIARHRALKAQLSAHFAPVLDEAVPDRLRALLTPDAAVDTSLAARREVRRVRFSPQHWGAIAASLVLGLTFGLQPWKPAADVGSDGDRLVAMGGLADALDRQLASNQPNDAPVRVGLSFRDKDGRACRSFQSAATDGIACRDADQWTLERTLRGKSDSEYRQASSDELASVAAAMMVGEPFDAADERAARDAGWGR